MRRFPVVVPLFLGVLIASTPAESSAKTPVIIDTDIGTDIDDALALALALASPELELCGVTTVSDDTFTRAMIVCRFLEAVGQGDVPVAAGRAARDTPAIEGQYQYGLRPGWKHPEKETAVEFLHRQLKIRSGEITLITIGDLTNVAELVRQHPECKPWIKRLVLMGGSVRVGYGNKAQPDREWNLRSDVKSAQRVFTAGVPLTVAPLDATVQVRLTAPLRRRIFAQETALCWHLRALYELWGKETPTLFDPVAVTLALNESFCQMEDLRIEVDNEGFTREVRGPANCRVAMATRSDEYLDWYVRRIVAWRGSIGSEGPAAQPPGESKPINPVQPAARGGLPYRIHVAEDYETDIERRWWLAGRLVNDEVRPGSARACRGVLCRDFDDQMGDQETIYRAVVFNPVPGPPMGRNTRLSFRYRLVGSDMLRVQIYSLSKGYHRCLTLTGLPQGRWRAATVDMTQARRPDGSGGPLSENERIDDIQFYVDRRADVTIDDVVLFDVAAADEKRPFPRRIHFTGWFDTGRQGREWPGDFEIVPHDPPLGWFAARSVPRPRADAPWLRVALRGPRPLRERTCLRFRYRLTNGNDFRVVLANAKTNQQVEVTPESFTVREWAEAVVEFPPHLAPRLRHADEIRFLLKPGAELLVDDLLLYEPGEAAGPDQEGPQGLPGG
jgi:inosine-uridine nucleoside N-ribohydrolase